MLGRVIDIFRHFDPDIVFGYETKAQSIGYVCRRAEHLKIKMQDMLSRTPRTFKQLNVSYYNQEAIRQQMQINAMGGPDDYLNSTKNEGSKKNQSGNSYF